MLEHKYKFAEKKKAQRSRGKKPEELTEMELRKYRVLKGELGKKYARLRRYEKGSKRERELKKEIKIIRRELRVLLEWEEPIIPSHPKGPDFDWLVGKMLEAYYEARKNKRGTVDEQKFEENYLVNTIDLTRDIYNYEYEIGRSIAFIVHKPVDREIFAAEFRDRIVHHFLIMMIGKWWDNRFICNSFSCRKGKGTHAGQRALLHDMRSQFAETGDGVVIKLDIKGFFMHINKKILYRRIRWGLKMEFGEDEWLYKLCRYLAEKIIFDSPQDNCVIKGTVKDWTKIPIDKTLFCQPDERGLPIGNLSSQLFANVYLDLFDRFVVYQLGYKHYGRYVDDFYFVISRKELGRFMIDLEELIAPFLEGMGLKLHPKKRYIQNVGHAVSFVGQYISMDFQQPSARTRRNFNQYMHDFVYGGYSEEGIKSYIGTLRRYSSFLERTFKYYGQEYER